MRADLFDSLVVTNFPYPLAHAYRRVREDKESREALCAALQQLLGFVGQVQLLDYLSGEVRQEELTEELRQILERPPSAGIWLGWIERIAAFQRKAEVPSFLAAGEVFTGRASRKTLGALVEMRNRWAHGNADFKVGTFRRDLFETMAQVRGLHTSSLFCPHGSRMIDQLHHFKATRLQGDYAQPGEIEGRSSLALESDKVHLYERNSRHVLSLYPFSLYERCSHCEQKHFFVFDRVRNRKVVYSAVAGGHEHVSADAYMHLERIFRHAKPTRERPRHFSIPGEFGSLPRTLGAGDAVGPYRIEALIKIGGMAQVYRATDTRTNVEYALKILPLEMSRDPMLMMRFDEEAHNMRKVEHPNVVKLQDLGEDFGDRYLVFDLAVGGSIGGQPCRDLSDVKGSLPEAEIVRIGRQICEALQHIHSLGILHRDLKPGNVLVSGDRVLTADFGIARGRGESGMTMTGLPVGTPEYMSPEQVQQEDPDHRSDLYSLGCILYELATGRPPFRSDTPLTTAMYQVQASPPRIEDLNPKISKGLCNIIYKLLQKSPQSRHGSARELFDDLGAVDQDPAGPQVVLGQKTPQDALEETRSRERARARKRLTLVSVLFLVALVLGFGGRAAWRGYRFRAFVAQAREAWEAGPERWEEACAALDAARHIDARGSSLGELLAEISLHGSIVLDTPGRELTFLVERDKGAASVFPWPARLGVMWSDLAAEMRVVSGQELRLPLGHYRAVPELDGVRRDELAIPVCLTQRVYRKDADSWSPGPRLPPLEAIANELNATPTPLDFAIGERFHCDDLRFPAHVPDGFRYVNGGPFFRAETGFAQSSPRSGVEDGGEPSDPAITYPSFRLVEDELEAGFLMGNETTIAEFQHWFELLGRDFCAWMIDNERVLLGRQTIRQVRESVRQVPIELQLEYWSDRLSDGINPADIGDADTLVDLIFQEELKGAKEKWQQREQRIRESLAQEERKTLPVGNVDFAAALAYARTHEPIRRAEFSQWIEREIESSRGAERVLDEFRRKLSSDPQAEIRKADFPPERVVGWREGLSRGYAPSTLFSIYIETLYYHVDYAAQLPADALVAWARANPERIMPASLRARLPELEAGLANAHQWLYETRSDGSPLYMPVVATYAYESQLLDRHPRSYCEQWVRARIQIERDRGDRLNRLNVSLPQGEASAVLSDIPFDLRLEFGWAQGWDLPEDRQWEKAFRGADDRPYPWGLDFDESVLGTEDGPTPLEQISHKDLSPHGVARLGAQVSEWVHLREGLNSELADFLKGGNYRFDGSACNAGQMIRLPRGQARRWTGFRVIKNLPDG